jgi:DHA2 family multidrug resistance protein-like MFS transporter
MNPGMKDVDRSMEQRLEPARDGLPRGLRGRAMLVVMVGLSLAVLDNTLLNLALPLLARELQVDAAQALWVITAYQLTSLALVLPLAALGERLGYRRVYLTGVLLFSLASVGAMCADSLAVLIVARALQGMGAAGIMSANAALMRLIHPKALLGRGMAVNSLVIATATMAGPTVAAMILSVASWPWLFAANLPLGLLTLWLGLRALPSNPGPRPTDAAPSAFDVMLNILVFSLILLGAGQLGGSVHGRGVAGAWLPSGGWLLGAGLVLGAWYLRRQRPLSRPLFPVDLLRIPVFALSMCGSVCAFCAQMLAYLALPFLLLESHGLSPLEAGMLLTAWPLATMLTAPLVGRLIGRLADGLLGGAGMALFACGLWLLAAMPAQAAGWDMAWRMLLAGSGFALYQSPNNHAIVSAAPLSRSGAAGGMLSSARLAGQALGTVVLATIFRVSDGQGGNGEILALVVAGGFAALAGMFSMLRRPRTEPASDGPG